MNKKEKNLVEENNIFKYAGIEKSALSGLLEGMLFLDPDGKVLF